MFSDFRREDLSPNSALAGTLPHTRGGGARLTSLVGGYAMSATLRQAVTEDIPAMHRVRLSVAENKLASPDVTEAAYVPAIEHTGRGWVIDIDGEVVAFAIGNRETGNIWALFVEPRHEGCGYGRRLHEVMISWLFSLGVTRAWLSTEPHTRAQKFYQAAGWTYMGVLPNGEASYELRNPNAPCCPEALPSPRFLLTGKENS